MSSLRKRRWFIIGKGSPPKISFLWNSIALPVYVSYINSRNTRYFRRKYYYITNNCFLTFVLACLSLVFLDICSLSDAFFNLLSHAFLVEFSTFLSQFLPIELRDQEVFLSINRDRSIILLGHSRALLLGHFQAYLFGEFPCRTVSITARQERFPTKNCWDNAWASNKIVHRYNFFSIVSRPSGGGDRERREWAASAGRAETKGADRLPQVSGTAPRFVPEASWWKQIGINVCTREGAL